MKVWINCTKFSHNKVTLKKNPRIVSEMEADIWFEPELVLEIVASEITLSPIHKTGLNLIKENLVDLH